MSELLCSFIEAELGLLGLSRRAPQAAAPVLSAPVPTAQLPRQPQFSNEHYRQAAG
jgi:hypothetical protein